jgi:hypothetical protein
VRRIAWLLGVVVLVASASFVALYLSRWEWTRALWTTMVFVAAEVALASALILRKLGQLSEQLKGQGSDAAVLARIQETRPHHARFAWLKDSVSQTNVFITLLLGGGVILSGLAWVVDRLAGRTTTPSKERALARSLGSIAFPSGGLVADEAALLAQDLPACDDPDLRMLVGDTTPR